MRVGITRLKNPIGDPHVRLEFSLVQISGFGIYDPSSVILYTPPVFIMSDDELRLNFNFILTAFLPIVFAGKQLRNSLEARRQ